MKAIIITGIERNGNISSESFQNRGKFEGIVSCERSSNGRAKKAIQYLASLVLLVLIAQGVVWGQTTIVNYDFNQATTYANFAAVSPLSTASGISAVASGTAIGVATGTATTGTPYTANGTTPYNTALNQTSGGGTNEWTFTLTGSALASYASFNVYYQGLRSTGGTIGLTISYSLNGGAYSTTSITGSANPISLSSSGTWYPVNYTMPATLNNPATSIAFRITIGNGNTGTTTIDNFEVRGTLVCTNPTAYSVTGGGVSCSGGSGVAIGLANSQTSVNYQLYRSGTTAVGTPVPGSTGSPISFGNQAIAGTYTVVATTATGGCTSNMTGNATVSISTPVASIAGKTDITCYAANDATLTISASGGTSPYTFSINDGATYQAATGTDLRLYTGLLPDVAYKIKVRDANLCISK
jgi:hypothetical protein